MLKKRKKGVQVQNSSAKQNINTQLLDFDVAAWVIDIPVHDMKLAFMKAPLQAKASTPQPAFQTKYSTCQITCVTNDYALFDAPESAPSFSSTNATLNGHNSSPATSMVFRNSFNTLSLALEEEEDNAKALTTFSLSPTTGAPSYVSAVPEHSKNKHQMCKTFHSKPKSYATLTKKPSPNIGMRSSHSSMKKQPSPMAKEMAQFSILT